MEENNNPKYQINRISILAEFIRVQEGTEIGELKNIFNIDEFAEIINNSEISTMVIKILKEIPEHKKFNKNLKNIETQDILLFIIIAILCVTLFNSFLFLNNPENILKLSAGVIQFFYSLIGILTGINKNEKNKKTEKIIKKKKENSKKKLFELFNQLTEKLATVKNQDLAKKMAKQIGGEILATISDEKRINFAE